MPHDLIIVGGGISGLTLGWHLQQQSELDFRVLEAGDRVGGTVACVRDSGFLMEMGPNGFLDRVPFTLDLAQQLGLSDELQASSSASSKRFLMHKGSLHALPESPKAFLRTKTLSLGGKLRVALERFKRKQKEGVEETGADFVRRRLRLKGRSDLSPGSSQPFNKRTTSFKATTGRVWNALPAKRIQSNRCQI